MANFYVYYNMNERGLPTLFKHRQFTINQEQREDWDYSNLDKYLTKYTLQISDNVMRQYQHNDEVTYILKELQEAKEELIVSNNKSSRYGGEKQYIKCRIPIIVLNYFKKLFISTIVYDSEHMRMQQSESITFKFDTYNKTVVITDLLLYEPKDNPYFKYARNTASSLSVEAIGLDKYSIDNNKDISDFYDRRKMSAWKERSKLENEKGIEDKAGIYMLYDMNKNHIYVGKGIHLKERMLQHTTNPNDPIPDFTHYRYSVISEEYYEFLYLIENAAIHDIAWLIDMPTASNYKPALAKKLSTSKLNLNTCKLVNNLEHQTRKQ